MDIDFLQNLAKQAAAKVTARSRQVKVNQPGGAQAVHTALHTAPGDARQLPWHYGEKRQPVSPAVPAVE